MIERQNIKKDRPLAPKYRVRRAEGASNPKRFGVAAKGKRIYIRTFGCQMNTRDSEALLGLFLEKGYVAAQSEKEADVILVNTCSVRGHAEQRAISFLGSLKKKAYSDKRIADSQDGENKKHSLNAKRYSLTAKPIIGLIGCMAKNRGEELFKKMGHIDLICGPAPFFRIPEYVERIKDSGVGGKRIRIKDLEDKARDESF